MRALGALLCIVGIVVTVGAVAAVVRNDGLIVPTAITLVAGLLLVAGGVVALRRAGPRKATRYAVAQDERSADSEWDIAADDARE